MFKPGTLWTLVQDTSDRARKCGALEPIVTEEEFVQQWGMSFLVRILSKISPKVKAKQERGAKFNPFLPYEEDLFVADISPTHLCILNKYNVVDNHLLIITRSFQEQQTWLTLEDMVALSRCMAEYEALAFYNGGRIAGASQRHKHLQLIPYQKELLISTIVQKAEFTNSIGTIPHFPFCHAIAKLDSSTLKSPGAFLNTYYELLQKVGLLKLIPPTGTHQTGAYNFLATREYMLIIPRSQERCQSISVNSLGFAGAFLVHNQQQRSLLKQLGPINLLKNVTTVYADDCEATAFGVRG